MKPTEMQSANNIHVDLGTAKDNQKSPIHDWYKFTAGFSYKFIDNISENEKLTANSLLFDPFAGCGTTLVSAQKKGIYAVGNEGQEFMFDIISAKLEWDIDGNILMNYMAVIYDYVYANAKSFDVSNANVLLQTLYDLDILQNIYSIKNAILLLVPEKKYHLFLNLALSQSLHKVSNVAIAVPYIVRGKGLKRVAVDNPAWYIFNKIVSKMSEDVKGYAGRPKTSQVFLQDSRFKNINIESASADICVTSPPYLNNLDYGESSKVHSHFFDITKNWNDVTEKVRKNLVTGSTTHYKDKDFNFEAWCASEFAVNNQNIIDQFIDINTGIKQAIQSGIVKRKKSFDILFCLYFTDMYSVLTEIRRVVKAGAKAYLIVGDSAPYGVYVPTTELLAKVALNCGFSEYTITKIRNRGAKWKGLTYRHNMEVSENILMLK